MEITLVGRCFELSSTNDILQVLKESAVMLRSAFMFHLHDGLDFTLKDEEMLVSKVDSATLEECLDLGIGRRASIRSIGFGRCASDDE